LSGNAAYSTIFFKVDEFFVAHEQIDGHMGAAQRQLVFERGTKLYLGAYWLKSRL
jgi:hypothetical protein